MKVRLDEQKHSFDDKLEGTYSEIRLEAQRDEPSRHLGRPKDSGKVHPAGLASDMENLKPHVRITRTISIFLRLV